MTHIKTDTLLKAENIHLSYGENVILEISILYQGHYKTWHKNKVKVVSLIGRSGIGKTQLFRNTGRFAKPTSVR